MNWILIAGINGFLAVVIGAFGAHGLKGHMTEAAMESYHTGSYYHLVHAVVLLTLALNHYPRRHFRKSLRLFLAAQLLFSGSLYLYALSTIKFWAYITPIGGVLFLAAWIYTGIEGTKTIKKKSQV